MKYGKMVHSAAEAIVGDFAFVKAWKGDALGNLSIPNAPPQVPE
ncbi:hypothetical protein [Paenibacillus popilliae]|nr:hypothetical protein [Paenibacillus popilliae]